ncbi:hypothetical protein [Streptomyces naphthomycinicus]|uniref:hypothetical protein n=1 Tax=Streptomyces naphthomycinicus TaxID=2872625 RepID=UPI001CED81C6|nr:hypothetical protein [Streptomyces sp. TML10]
MLRQRLGWGFRQTLPVLVLVFLGCLASWATDVFLLVSPSLHTYGCSASDGPGGRSLRVLLHSSGSQDHRCGWEKALAESAPENADPRGTDLSRLVEISEGEGGAARVRLSATVTAGGAVAGKVRRGDAADDVQSFVEEIWGVQLFSGRLPQWKLPEYSLDRTRRHALIAVTGTVPALPGTVELYSGGPTRLRMSLSSVRFRAVRTDWNITGQGPHSLSADVRGPSEPLRVGLARAGATASRSTYPDDPSLTLGLARLRRDAGRAGDLLTAVGWALLSAAGWCALLLAARSGVLDPLGAGNRLRHLVRVAGAVLLVHVIVLVAPWVAVPSGASGTVLGGSFQDAATRSLGWDIVGYPAVPGALVLMVAAILVMAPRMVRALAVDDGPVGAFAADEGLAVRGRLGSWRVVLLALAAVTALAAAVLAVPELVRLQPDYASAGARDPEFVAFLLPVLLAVVLAVISVAGAAVARFAGWRIRLSSMLWASAFVPLLAVVAAVHGQGGVLPFLVRWSGPLLAGAVAVLVTGWVAWWVVTGSRPAVVTLVLLFPVAAALAVAWNTDEATTLGWWQLFDLAQRLDAVLGLVVVVAVVRSLREWGRAPVLRRASLRGHRALGILLMFVMAAGSYSLLKRPSAVVVGAAACMVWLLFPYRQIGRAAVVLGQRAGDRTGAVVHSARSGAARRALPALRKAARDKVTEGMRPYAVAQRQLRAVERLSFDARRRGADDDVSTRELAFGAFVGDTPWERGVRAARAGALLGAPWTLLSLAGAAVGTSAAHAPYPVLSLLTETVPVLLTWVGFGLLYGYFFPLLRGETGLAKALWMYGVMLVPTVVQTVASRDPSHWSSWADTLLYAFQALAFAMTLGLRADASVLAANRMRPARLSDIHDLGSITAWWSSVAVALATGVATVIVAGLQPFLLDVFPQAPAPPASPATTAGDVRR